MSSSSSVALPPKARTSSSSSSSAPTVRATTTTCAPWRASSSATARPMPREAPVTSARRSLKGLLSCMPGSELASAVLPTASCRPRARQAPPLRLVSRSYRKWTKSRWLANFSEQRKLPRHRLAALVSERRRVVAGKAMVGELRAARVAMVVAHRAIDAVDRQEGEAVGAEVLAHALEVLIGREQVDLVGRVDAVIVGVRDGR